MSGQHDPYYVVPLDGARVLMQPPFVPRGIIINNQTTATCTVVDGRAGSWSVKPGETRHATIHNPDSNYIALLSPANGLGECVVSFTQAPGDDTGTTPTVAGPTALVLLYESPAGEAAGGWSHSFPVPPGIRHLLIEPEAPGTDLSAFSTIDIFGDVTLQRLIYIYPFYDVAVNNTAISPYVAPWYDALDQNALIDYSKSTAAARLRVYGSLDQGMYSRGPDGSQLVTISQPSGWGGLRVGWSSPMPVSGPLTDAQLAARLPLSVKQTAPPSRPTGIRIATAVLAGGAGNKNYGTMAAAGAGGYLSGEFYFNQTAGATGATVQIFDPSAGFILTNFAATAGIGQTSCRVGPSLTTTAGANAIQQAELYDGCVIVVNHAGVGAISYTLDFYPGRLA